MKRLEPIIAIIALIVAVLVGFGVYHLVYVAPKQTVSLDQCPPLPEMKEVMVASGMINTGDPIAPSITYEKWPTSSLRGQMYLKNQMTPEQIKSLIARRIINSGEPITKNSVVDRKEHGVLSALLNPGDIVDVILALNPTGKEKEDEEMNKTILCGVRVLALDQHLSSSLDVVNKKISEVTQTPKSVTLEVTPRQASALASAVKLGSLSLSLHSTNDGKNVCVESSLKAVDQIKIIRGDGTQNTSQPKQ
jgi:pilus assembly protein CpaB